MRPSVLIVSLSVLFGLAGCGSGGLDDVKDWMKGVREQTKVAVPKLSEPKKFSPFTYAVKDSPDPFNASKLAVALAKQRASSGNSSIKPPDLERRREPLEYFPLDTIKMVGTLQKAGVNHALLQVDRTVYQAKVGNYVGQNFGMITNVTEGNVDIKEIVQDASGEWVERQSKLELQEAIQQGAGKK
ncbi:MAG: pilus assembly protein PilP [Burkholderiales bacterium]|nr:pilus assembly protein PilP [Burkholderiales bacterium]